MDVYKYLPYTMVLSIQKLTFHNDITEIRIRSDKPVQITVFGKTNIVENTYVADYELEEIFYKMCQHSINIYDDEISNGYITLYDGCRVGIAGEFYYNKTDMRYVLKKLTSLNIRIARDFTAFDGQEQIFTANIPSTLVIGPPHSGKTSLLKLYAKHLSQNYRVTVCDERKELYCKEINADILMGIKKSDAINMATRTLNPQYIICDEIGSVKEAEEILSAVNTGVEFICSVHGNSVEQALKRPNIKLLTDSGIFHRYVTVCQKNQRFYIKEITDA